MRNAGALRVVAIVALIVVVIAAGLGGFFWWKSASDASSARKFKAAATADWKRISADADRVRTALLKATSKAELAEVDKQATAMRGDIASVTSRMKNGVPPAYKDAAAKAVTALGSIDRYLELVGELSTAASAADLQNNKGALDDRARQAQADVNDLTSSASWLKAGLQGDFFEAGAALQAVLIPVDPAVEAQKQAVNQALQTFMHADIFDRNFDIIWPMLDARLHLGFDYFKITKDKIVAGWDKAWGEHRPVNFYVSEPQITITGPGTATARAIVYVEHGETRIEEVRLVNEGGWKIDSYPFVGWL